MKRRLLATFLSLCLLVGLLPTVALAADEETGAELSAVCTCEALCTEEAVDETCPVCGEDYTLCAYEEFPNDQGEPVPCTVNEGCTLKNGHEGDCVLVDEPLKIADKPNLSSERNAGSDFYLTFSSTSKFSLKTSNGKKNWDGTLYYSRDTLEWSEWEGLETPLSDTLYLRGSGNTYLTTNKDSNGKVSYSPFVFTAEDTTDADISCTGNIETLLDHEAVENGTPITMAAHCYNSLFKDCVNLVTAPALPATSLSESCYRNMFHSSGITKAPELPATELAAYCYQSMFNNCDALTAAPALPATTLATDCYRYMFEGCDSLRTAPELPAGSLAETCYGQMFKNCTALTVAPDLPATTLAKGCYTYMFQGCTALTTAPALPAQDLAENCYAAMFMGCTKLTAAPDLPALTLSKLCYSEMFSSCTSLEKAPALSALTVVEGSYSKMFYGCTALRVAPRILATSFENGSCGNMFEGCSNLHGICLDGTADYDAANIETGLAKDFIIYTNGNMKNTAVIRAFLNGGTFAPDTEFDQNTLADPVKDGSIFAGWYQKEDLTGDKVTEPSVNGGYYAKWTEVSDYDIAEGDEDITLTMTYGETPAFKTATVEVPKEGSILNVESSNEAIIEATFEGTTVTITAADNLNAGTYAETVYVYAADGSTHWINVSLTVNKADSTVNPDEDSVHITATYGETITLTAEVAKAQTNGIALMTAQDEVEFLCGKTSLGTALVRYSDDSHTTGTATLTYDTSKGGIPVGTSTITAVYGGSVNLNGNNTNSIQITLNKINTSIDITPDRTSLTGGGTVTLTVDKSGLPTGAEVNVTCDNGITPSKNADGTWAATLPNSTEDYTFTASYTGNENHNASSDTCTVSVTRRSSGGGGGGGSTTYTVSVDAGRNGDVTVSPSRASYGDTVTITVEPDEGYELDELIVTDSDGDEIDVERVSATRYTFEMPRSRVTVEATFVEITEEPDLPTFTDVSEDAYYADAVLWAVTNGVTYGTSATTFSPDMAVSRAQMVTFLWRAHGSPEATGTNPFTDVSTSDYYYDAVLWAVANGVTNGTSATTFSPDMAVTRAQAVTFQWRAAGSPVVSGSSFGDVAADAYYVNAVTWAVANGITNGTSGTTFSPDVVVSRAQAVTFLHRELG